MYNEAEAVQFFKAYNQAIADHFERITADIDPRTFDDPDFYTQIRHSTLNAMQDWHQEPLDVLSGKTPDEYIDTLEGKDELLAFTALAARHCDEELPDMLKIKLGQNAPLLQEGLREMALSVAYEAAETTEQILEAAMAIKLLGEWQDTSFMESFISRFTAVDEPQELITDAGQYFFSQLGQTALDRILELLIEFHKGEARYTSSYEYLLVFITQLGQTHRGTDIYPLLRTAFRKSKRKVIAAICIGDYGDARGVVLLRNYIIEYEKDLDRQLYYESLSSIKRLGGDTKDLPDPFRDFSGGGPTGGPIY